MICIYKFYIQGGDSGRRRTTDVNIDHGYDTSDPFVDDSEAVSFRMF